MWDRFFSARAIITWNNSKNKRLLNLYVYQCLAHIKNKSNLVRNFWQQNNVYTPHCWPQTHWLYWKNSKLNFSIFICLCKSWTWKTKYIKFYHALVLQSLSNMETEHDKLKPTVFPKRQELAENLPHYFFVITIKYG